MPPARPSASISFIWNPDLESGDLSRLESGMERVSNLALALAYVVSVAFYLRLMSAFALRKFGLNEGVWPDLLTTVILVFIGLTGWLRGLSAMERLEEWSVAVKLGVIVALLSGLAVHDLRFATDWHALPGASGDAWHIATVLAGLLLLVQGFETSRFIGHEYPAELRVRTMRWAQLASTVIYIVFLLLITPLLGVLDTSQVEETAIIDLASKVAWILGPMLVIAAIMSQFSAAIADTIGSAGLLHEESRGRLAERLTYPLIAAAAAVLVWSANLFEIIALASRAFAFYYLVQTLLAWRLSGSRTGRSNWSLKRLLFAITALLLAFVVLFGQAAA
ncbi:MAG: hypothetical protein Kow0020_03560 [Wenzhouxiangellaceae bacterium]